MPIQIIYKRKDPSYKALVDGHTTGCSATPEHLRAYGQVPTARLRLDKSLQDDMCLKPRTNS
jgi:hypothetical protein